MDGDFNFEAPAAVAVATATVHAQPDLLKAVVVSLLVSGSTAVYFHHLEYHSYY